MQLTDIYGFELVPNEFLTDSKFVPHPEPFFQYEEKDLWLIQYGVKVGTFVQVPSNKYYVMNNGFTTPKIIAHPALIEKIQKEIPL